MKIKVNEKLCKGCGICVAFCPKKVLEMQKHPETPVAVRIEDCIGCMFCELRCPDFAIEVTKDEQ